MLRVKCFKTFKVVVIAMTLVYLSGTAMAMETVEQSAMDHSMMDHSQHGSDEHAQHRAMMDQKGYSRKEVSYQLPDVMLIDQNGNKMSVAALFDGNSDVILNFIFTSCTTICPVLSATFSQMKIKYSAELNGVKMVSISIDPEYDTPDRLKEYAQRFHAQDDWTFLTGDLAAVMKVLNAFNAYRGDKMSHVPLTFLRKSSASSWIRLEGFASASELLKEYRIIGNNYSKDVSQR